MTDSIIVLCTCADDEQANRIAGSLVEKRLAACVNVLPGVRSVYRWHGEVESSHEVLLLVKSTSDRFPALRDAITRLHSYDTPEVIAVPICAASEKYLSWIHEQV